MKKINEIKEHFKVHGPSYKAKLLGSGDRKGLLYYIAVYFLSITFAFVFIYPVFYMFMISLMSNTDLVDSTILWIPSEIYWKNYLFAVRGLTLNEVYAVTVWQILTDRAALVSPLMVEVRKLVVILSIPFLTLIIGSIYSEKRVKLFPVPKFI